MNRRIAIMDKTVVAVIAVVAGLLGGVIHDWMRGGALTAVEASTPGVLRAKRFEVISAAGRTLSYWGPDSDPHIPASTPRGVVLVFMDMKGTRRCQIGSRAGDVGPELLFYDKDGPLPGDHHHYSEPRFSVGLGYDDDAILTMRNRESWRILLGAGRGDAPSPDEDTWGLRIRGGSWSLPPDLQSRLNLRRR